MAELASAYPTAGGLYFWACRLGGRGWAWWTAWLNLIGQFAIVAGINYAAAGFINATIVDQIRVNPKVRAPDAALLGGVFSVTPDVKLGIDQPVWLEFDQQKLHLFDGKTGRALPAA